jgi:maleylacetate reductase
MQLGLKMKLADLGVKAADLDRAAELATQSPYPNPAPIERTAVRGLLESAYTGRRPE